MFHRCPALVSFGTEVDCRGITGEFIRWYHTNIFSKRSFPLPGRAFFHILGKQTDWWITSLFFLLIFIFYFYYFFLMCKYRHGSPRRPVKAIPLSFLFFYCFHLLWLYLLSPHGELCWLSCILCWRQPLHSDWYWSVLRDNFLSGDPLISGFWSVWGRPKKRAGDERGLAEKTGEGDPVFFSVSLSPKSRSWPSRFFGRP